ncbi:MAG: hypothetical protein HYU53_18985 [Acidobacteria bacterium]|nr:hypothetical protein [Acidobacteriota bacterium]
MFATDCPHCHDRRALENVSVTPFHIWIHCQSCGHVWSRAPLAYALARFVTRLREGEQPAERPAERPIELPPAAGEPAMLCFEDLPAARRVSAGEDMEAWLRQGDADGPPRFHGPEDVSHWLDSDPFGGRTQEQRAARNAADEEFFLPRVARPAPATLAERLDAFHDGLVRLEAFVANYTRREEVEAQRAMAEIEAAAAQHASASAKRATVLRFKVS